MSYQIKPLDSHFTSVGEALFSFYNRANMTGQDTAAIADAIPAFCQANNLVYRYYDTERNMPYGGYFENDEWVMNFLQKGDYIRDDDSTYYKLDHGNRPVVFVKFTANSLYNFEIAICGDTDEVEAFVKLSVENFRIDPEANKKARFLEVVSRHGDLGVEWGYIENPRIAQPEYYPYLEGGPDALIKDFMESTETVLVLMGPPGTGKSSLISAVTASLKLMPIYAKKATVVNHPEFISTIFKESDEYMDKVVGTPAKQRKDLFKDTTYRKELSFNGLTKKPTDDNLLPVIVVEDGDVLIAPRSAGNQMMAELLNETDGVGSNTTRKLIISTNLCDVRGIDEALLRPGRCYDVVHCRLLSPSEAVAARKAAGLPDFVETPTTNISLAAALRPARKRIVLSNSSSKVGF